VRLLILGGTADGRKLANVLHQQGIEIIYSVAGLVRTPDVGCKVVSGGFSQFGGLQRFVELQNVQAIVDVTHPYAERMTTTAQQIATVKNIPYWRFHRPAWQADDNYPWHEFSGWQSLASQLCDYSAVLFTVGQLEPSLVEQLKGISSKHKLIIRTAAPAKFELFENMQWLKAIGPFTFDDEFSLMKKHNIKALVSKNSGGESTSAKLAAAKQLQIPIFMQARPTLPNTEFVFSDLTACQQFILQQVNHKNLSV